MINGIFFDLFGTLLEYGDMTKAWNGWLTNLHKTLVPHGLNVSEEKLALHCDQFFSKEAPASELNSKTVYEYRINNLCRELNITIKSNSLKYVANETAKAWQNEITLAPDSIKTLQILKMTKRLALITNFDHPPHISRVMSNFGLDHFLEEIVISSDVGYKKPDPEIFNIALKKTSLTAQEVVYVGDTEDDINGAIASGIQPVLISKNTENNKIAYDYYHKMPIDNIEKTDNNINVLTISKLIELTKLFP